LKAGKPPVKRLFNRYGSQALCAVNPVHVSALYPRVVAERWKGSDETMRSQKRALYQILSIFLPFPGFTLEDNLTKSRERYAKALFSQRVRSIFSRFSRHSGVMSVCVSPHFFSFSRECDRFSPGFRDVLNQMTTFYFMGVIHRSSHIINSLPIQKCQAKKR